MVRAESGWSTSVSSEAHAEKHAADAVPRGGGGVRWNAASAESLHESGGHD